MILSVDLETTGIEGQIIEFAAVIEDHDRKVEDLDYFHCFVLQPRYDFEIIAAKMNRRVIEAICDFHQGTHGDSARFVRVDLLNREVYNWLDRKGWDGKDVTFTGKNFATFDRRFLDEIEFFKLIPMHRRVLDPGSMYWIPEVDGDTLPGTETCLKRAGLDSEIKHNALEDARNVIRLIRRKI